MKNNPSQKVVEQPEVPITQELQYLLTEVEQSGNEVPENIAHLITQLKSKLRGILDSKSTYSSVIWSQVITFLESYSNSPRTTEAYLNALKSFSHWCLDQALTPSDIQYSDMKKYVDHLCIHYKPASRKQHLSAIRLAFDWLMENGFRDGNPVPLLRNVDPKPVEGYSEPTSLLTLKEIE